MWPKNSENGINFSFGETFVYDYLLGFFNLYIQDFAKISGLKSTEDEVE